VRTIDDEIPIEANKLCFSPQHAAEVMSAAPAQKPDATDDQHAKKIRRDR
jgi:hypothetical protein